jgi:hypothetical protein
VQAGRSIAAVVPVAWIAAVGVGLIAFGLCLWRLMPGVGFWDTAEFQMVLPVMGTAHPTGYPTYVLLGWLASLILTPIGEPALRINVLSAILVGVGVGLTVDIARRLTGSLVLGVAAGLGVVLTPIVWAIGTHADPHALHFALLALIVWLLVRWEHARHGSPFGADIGDDDRAPDDDAWIDPAEADPPGAAQTHPAHADRAHADRWLVAAAVVAGLSTGNHSLTLLLGPPIILYVLAVGPGILSRPRLIATCLAAAAIPAVLVRLEMVLRAGWFRAPFVYADPSTWNGFWYVTSGQQFHGWLTDPLGDWPRRIGELAAIAGQQLGPLTPFVAAGFLVTAVRVPRYALLSGSALAITCFFNSVYPDGAIDRYYIGPVLFAWTWLALLAVELVEAVFGAAEGRGAGRRPTGNSFHILRGAGVLVAAAILIGPSLLALPARSRSVDRTDDRSAQAWMDEVLTGLEQNAVVISWWSYSTPLWYGQLVDHRRPDIFIIDDRTRLDLNLGELDQVIDKYIADRPVYVIRNGNSELDQLARRYSVTPLGAPHAPNVFRVTLKTAAALPAVGASR